MGAVTRVAGDAGAAGDEGEQPGEAAVAVVVHGAREADRRGTDPLRGELEDCRDRSAAPADRAVRRDRVALGGGVAGHPRRAGAGDERSAAVDQRLAHGGESGALVGDRRAQGFGAAEVVGEGEVDHAVGPGGCGVEHLEVGEAAADAVGAGVRERPRGGVGPGEPDDRVAVAEQLGDDGGADQTGAAGDEDVHGTPQESDGTLVPSDEHRDGTKVSSLASSDGSVGTRRA